MTQTEMIEQGKKLLDTVVKNRSELLFLYDIKFGNPNGDPLNENRPRIDSETGINLVTDVRLKRTIRDYLWHFLDEEIFIREINLDGGWIQDAKLRAEDFLTNDKTNFKTIADMKENIDVNVLKQCVDVRLFGITMPIELNNKQGGKDSIGHTGAVQFSMGRSLHKVSMEHIKGTGGFASRKNKTTKTFREERILCYSLICFHGIINENVAKETGLTEQDVDLLLDAIWNGTKNLLSRSKFGQQPRLLIQVVYKNKNYHLGELNAYVKLETDKLDDQLRDVEEYKLDITTLYRLLKSNTKKIETIRFKVDPRIQFIPIKINEEDVSDLAVILKDINETTSELEV